ncbi:helix-turn-helix transcriptional regulator [Streptomyces sp. TLI_55]|uniref:helix-turn-helix transcriptional regulator n=1 Tax=Streptomyces sp. TLI_55 TaxID=1938861 RepID=UPI000C7E5CC2|nr:LuxR family transcriptional regulator [Streptomyces sp. TLI_55]
MIDVPPTANGVTRLVPEATPRGHGAQREGLLRRVLRLVHGHEGGVVWVEGPADAGKSCLLAFAAEKAALAGAVPLTAGGVAGGDLPPLAPLLDALARQMPGVAEPGPPHEVLRTVEDALRELSHEQPVLVVLDDLHLCDHLTLLAVRTLTARLAELPVLWVLAARSHLDVPAVVSLRRNLPPERTESLELTALDPDSVRLLVADLLGSRAGEAEPYLPLLGGLPGAIRHACALLRATAGEARQEVLAEAVAARRLDQLTSQARELVLTASGVGDSLGVRHLSRMLDRREAALLRPLREVLAAGLMRAQLECLAFVHPSVREAVAATLPAPLRLSVRRRSVELRLADGSPVAAATVPGATWRGLTRSELGVVRLIAHGATNREAAERLFVSPHTVNTHLRHAFEKLGVRSRVQLARLYAREVEATSASA